MNTRTITATVSGARIAIITINWWENTNRIAAGVSRT
jgi:hypothetical protein